MEDINVIERKDLIKKELLGFMVENNIIKSTDYFKWDYINIKERALYITKALQMLGVI